MVRVEQKRDKFCSTLQAGKPKGRSEYFYDDEAKERGTSTGSPKETD